MSQVCRSSRLRTSALLPYPPVDPLRPSRRDTPSLGWTAVTGDDVRAAAELCERTLEPALGADWHVPVPGLEFTVAAVVAHAAESPLWYSVDMWSGREDAAFQMKVLADASNSALLTSLVAASRALAAGVDAAPAGTRGFHPFGSPDPAGFAAMACDELLVHGDDAAPRARGRLHPGHPSCRGRADTLVPLARPGGRRRPVEVAAVGERPHRPLGAGTAERVALALRAAIRVGRRRPLAAESSSCSPSMQEAPSTQPSAPPVSPRTINIFVYSVERRCAGSGHADMPASRNDEVRREVVRLHEDLRSQAPGGPAWDRRL